MSDSHPRLSHAARLGQSHGARAGATLARLAVECGGVLLAVAGWLAVFTLGLVALLAGITYVIDLVLANRPLLPVHAFALLLAMLMVLSRAYFRLLRP
jgi:hypothetical protein